jgi:hypothetical protein
LKESKFVPRFQRTCRVSCVSAQISLRETKIASLNGYWIFAIERSPVVCSAIFNRQASAGHTVLPLKLSPFLSILINISDPMFFLRTTQISRALTFSPLISTIISPESSPTSSPRPPSKTS